VAAGFDVAEENHKDDTMLNTWKRACLLPSLLLALAGCDQFIYRADSIEGWVVDAGTGKPLEGVIVVANWELEGGFEGGVPIDELQIYETVTDERGRYYFPKWGPKFALFGKLQDVSPGLLFFKRGYRYLALGNEWHTGMDTTKSDWNGKTVKLERFVGTLAQYADSLDNLSSTLENVGHNVADSGGDPCGWKQFPRILRELDRLESEFRQAGVVKGTVVSFLKANDDLLQRKGCGSILDLLATQQ